MFSQGFDAIRFAGWKAFEFAHGCSVVSYQCSVFRAVSGRSMQDFKKPRVWEKSHNLTLRIYKDTSSFPRQEKYGLVSQMRRASSSVPANIAEGCGRDGNAELARFLGHCHGLCERVGVPPGARPRSVDDSEEDYGKLDGDTTEMKRMIASPTIASDRRTVH